MTDEPEFSAEHVAELLATVSKPNVVIVGGQAVNALAERYLDCDEALASEAPFTSKDLDVFASKGELLRWKRDLGNRASVRLPDPNHMGAVQNGILYFALPDGRQLKVDFMTAVYGLKDDAVRASAVPVGIAARAPVEVLILNPVLCVESRVANVVGLRRHYDNAHGLKQLRASIVACRHFIEELAQHDYRGALKHIESLFRVSCSRHAVKLYTEKGIDTFAALPSLDRLPPKFREQRYPRMLEILARKRRQRQR